jgi:hypothetical protein
MMMLESLPIRAGSVGGGALMSQPEPSALAGLPEFAWDSDQARCATPACTTSTTTRTTPTTWNRSTTTSTTPRNSASRSQPGRCRGSAPVDKSISRPAHKLPADYLVAGVTYPSTGPGRRRTVHDIELPQRRRFVVRLHYTGDVAFRWASGVLDWLAERGIEPYEVQQVLQYGKRWPRQGHTAQGAVLTIWGRTRAGRALLVVLWPERDSLDKYIAGARELDAGEEAELQSWEAGR